MIKALGVLRGPSSSHLAIVASLFRLSCLVYGTGPWKSYDELKNVTNSGPTFFSCNKFHDKGPKGTQGVI